MLAVDLIVSVVIALAVVWGLVKGLATALPLAGVAAGAVLGTRVPVLLGGELNSTFSLAAALPAALFLGALLAAGAERLGRRRVRRLRRRAWVNAVAGALVAGAAGVVVVWVLGPVTAQIDSLRNPIERSTILPGVNAWLTPPGPDGRNRTDPSIDDFPTFAGPRPDVAPADARAETDPEVKFAERSVVKVRILKCDGSGTGSGWFAAPGIVVTNAHVVSTAEAIVVRLRGSGPARKATAIWFDRVNDIALLRVPELRGVRPLTMVSRARTGTAGAALGFPKGFKDIRRARLGTTTSGLRGRLGGIQDDGVDNGLAGRLVTPFRSRVQPGSSGGPVVDLRGRVLVTTFAGSMPPGTGIGVPNRFVREALRKAGPPVSTGACKRGSDRDRSE